MRPSPQWGKDGKDSMPGIPLIHKRCTRCNGYRKIAGSKRINNKFVCAICVDKEKNGVTSLHDRP